MNWNQLAVGRDALTNTLIQKLAVVFFAAATLTVPALAQEKSDNEPPVNSTHVIVGQMIDRSDLPEDEFVSMTKLMETMTMQIDPSGILNVSVRPIDKTRFEITAPETTRSDVELLWKRIATRSGCAFRIVADSSIHPTIVKRARETADQRLAKVTQEDEREKTVGEWVLLAREIDSEGGLTGPFRFMPSADNLLRAKRTGLIVELFDARFGGTDADKRRQFTTWWDKNGFGDIEILICTPQNERQDVTEQFMEHATIGFDERGNPRVEFKLSEQGGKRMFSLTSQNKPQEGHDSMLGIIVNDRLLSGLRIKEPIQQHGVIEGRFTIDEVLTLKAIIDSRKFNLPIQPEWVSIEEVPDDK